MTFTELQTTISTALFTDVQAHRVFASESKLQINNQLTRLVQRGVLVRIKRGLYWFPNRPVDELAVAGWLVQPSYLSLETALHRFGLWPDIPIQLTSVCLERPCQFMTPLGSFSYSQVQSSLFFGFKSHQDPQSGLEYQSAEPEKAVLDYIYVRRIRSLVDSRIDLSLLDHDQLELYGASFPNWVRRVIDNDHADHVDDLAKAWGSEILEVPPCRHAGLACPEASGDPASQTHNLGDSRSRS